MRRHTISVLAAAIGVAVVASSPAMATNILVNPGFETGSLSPWFQSNDFGGPVDWTVSTADPHSGTFDAMDDGNKELQQNFTGILGSKITEISFWERHPNLADAPSYVEVLFSDGSSNHEIVSTSDTNWDFFNVTGLVDPTKTVTGLGIYGYISGGSGNITFLDDLTVNAGAVPEASTWAIMVAGFAGLACIGRRSRKRNEAAIAA